MPREESLYPADWRRIAEKDLRRAEHLVDIHIVQVKVMTEDPQEKGPVGTLSAVWVRYS